MKAPAEKSLPIEEGFTKKKVSFFLLSKRQLSSV